MIHNICKMPRVVLLGVQTEAGVEAIGFDLKPWMDAYPDMHFDVWATRPGEMHAYRVNDQELFGTVLYWYPDGYDTAIAGEGKVEISGMDGDRRKLSGFTHTAVQETSLGATKEPGGDVPPWHAELLTVAKEIKESADLFPDAPIPDSQLVTDADGNMQWIPRKETVEVVFLSETALVDDLGTFLLMSPWSEAIEAGSKYTVTYNGAPYELEAIPHDFEGKTVPALGNLSLSGGTGGDESAPFCLVAIPVSLGAQIGVYGILTPSDSPSSVTISVTGEKAVDTSGPIFDVRVPISYTDANGVEFGEADKTWAEVEKAHNAGKIIRVIGTMSDIYELSEYIGDIKAAHRANGMLALGFEMYTNLYMNEQGRTTRLMHGGDDGEIVFTVPD